MVFGLESAYDDPLSLNVFLSEGRDVWVYFKIVCYRGNSRMQTHQLILVWPGARKVKTTLIQTLVYQLSSILIVVWPGVRRVKMAFLVTRIHIDFFLLLLSYVYTLRLIGPISYSSEYDLMVYPQKYSDRFLTNTFWKLLRYITCIKYEIGPINRSV